MKFAVKSVLTCLLCLTFAVSLRGQAHDHDIFVPISRYLQAGDAQRLSAWFDDNLEITIFSRTIPSSRKQAVQILKSFFENHTPRSFEIRHKARSANMKFALGVLNAGGEVFLVTIFVSLKNNNYIIQQLKIEQLE